MDAKARQALVDRHNFFVIAGMAVLWMNPVMMFWMQAFGPLKSHAYPRVNTAPSAVGFLFWLGVSLLAWWVPESYFRLRGFEKNGRLYGALGVGFLKRFVADGELVNRALRRVEPGYRVITDKTSLQEYAQRTHAAEKSHLMFLLMGLFTTIYAFRIGWYGWGAYLAISNLIVNLWPILLQRYTRARIARAEARRRQVESRS